MLLKKLLIEVKLELDTDRRSVESVIEGIYTGLAKVISDGEFDTLDVNLTGERTIYADEDREEV